MKGGAWVSALARSTRSRRIHRRSESGFTILEIAVSLTVLSAGSAVLWYGLRASAHLDRLNRLHHAAVMLARSDLESLRSVVKQDIHDTLYLASGAGGEALLVVRRVMDSARIVNTLAEVVLDDKLSPKAAMQPLEVRVKVWWLAQIGQGTVPDASAMRDPEADGVATPDSDEGDGEGKPHSMASLIVKLPEYKWY
jgi:type II secretory pathway pseudopilin PulG